MKLEMSASVYSVVGVQYKDTDQMRRYLYDHTIVVDLPGYSIPDSIKESGNKVVPIILKTTSAKELEADPGHNFQEECSKLAKDALYLADYQLNRLASGMMQGTICGTELEAQMAAVELIDA